MPNLAWVTPKHALSGRLGANNVGKSGLCSVRHADNYTHHGLGVETLGFEQRQIMKHASSREELQLHYYYSACAPDQFMKPCIHQSTRMRNAYCRSRTS